MKPPPEEREGTPTPSQNSASIFSACHCQEGASGCCHHRQKEKKREKKKKQKKPHNNPPPSHHIKVTGIFLQGVSLPLTREGPCDIVLKVATESRETRIYSNPQAPEQREDVIPESHVYTSLCKENTVFYCCFQTCLFLSFYFSFLHFAVATYTIAGCCP